MWLSVTALISEAQQWTNFVSKGNNILQVSFVISNCYFRIKTLYSMTKEYKLLWRRIRTQKNVLSTLSASTQHKLQTKLRELLQCMLLVCSVFYRVSVNSERNSRWGHTTFFSSLFYKCMCMCRAGGQGWHPVNTYSALSVLSPPHIIVISYCSHI